MKPVFVVPTEQIRHGLSLAGAKLGAVGLFALAAISCGGSQPAAPVPVPRAAPVQPTLEVIKAPPAAPVITKQLDALRFMPANATVLIGLDFARLNAAPMVAKYRDRLIRGFPEELARVQQRCNLDLVSDLDWMLLSVYETDKFVLTVRGNFTQAQIEECMTNVPQGEKRTTISVDGPLVVYDDGTNSPTLAFWPSEGVVVLGQKESSAALKAASDQVEPFSGVNELVAAADSAATLWALGNPKTSNVNMPIEGVGDVAMSIEVGSTMDLIAEMNFDSEEKAKEANGMLGMGLGMAKGQPGAKPFISIIDKIKISKTGTVVGVSLLLTEDDIDLLEKILTPMVGGSGPPPPTP